MKKYGKSLLGELHTPCFIVELDTDNIVYKNLAMDNLLSPITTEEVLGKKFYEVIVNREFEKASSIANYFQGEPHAESYIYNQKLNLHLKIVYTKLEYQGKEYVICKYFQQTEIFNSNLTFEEAMTRCVYYFQQEEDEMRLSFMELLCQYYDCERAYIYRINHSDQTITCQSQYCTDQEFQVTHKLERKMDGALLIDWMRCRDELGLIEANRSHINMEGDSTPAKVLKTFHIDNLVLAMVQDTHHKVIGIVGISNRKSEFFDSRLLNTIARFVAQGVNRVALEETLRYIKTKDSLTGFYNRNSYNEMQETLKEVPPKTIGVIFININGLKKINKNLGYLEGDRHIKSASNTVKNHFPFPFYRISGDEFVAVAPNISKDELEERVNQLHQDMKCSEEYIFSMGHSWGTGNFNFPDLVSDADTVMYINKQEYYYSSNRHFTNVGDTTLSDLLSYLENDEFMVYLQPQVDLKDGSLLAAEALIRRFDKTNQKMVFPDQFIPLYEMKSVIRHVDFFVIDRVCQLLADWAKRGKSIRVSVNLSRVTLLEHGVVESIAEICDKYQVDHGTLIIEVTERVGLIENEVASSLVKEFKDHGFTISLDDFGCAYSNIVTLAQIQVDEVKVDKSLVDNLVTNEKNRILVKHILSMCNELEDTSTLAEGIESQEQAKVLYELGCKLGQGYYYSRPIPVSEFCEKYLN